MALEYSNAGFDARRLQLRPRGPILVCRWLQPHDRVLRFVGDILQAENTGSAYPARNSEDQIW